MDKNKLVLPISILLGCIVLGGFFYASQISKQNSIEKQQRIDLQAKTGQKKRDYIAKRKTDCLAIYKTESAKWNNVQGWEYDEPIDDPALSSYNLSALNPDTCEIIYKDNKTGDTFSKNF